MGSDDDFKPYRISIADTDTGREFYEFWVRAEDDEFWQSGQGVQFPKANFRVLFS